ncbi:hypothetical protein O3M35_008457 [Rhynocoris fuscipes]|uniref:C2H2-type domain-containing protein n=1 Tax=Rhynocoris fuscipes TaxID=488301 RepID=A0AAW1D7T9_9HEMI
MAFATKCRMDLTVICQWKDCSYFSKSQEDFYDHVKDHLPHLEVVSNSESEECYKCLWLNCTLQSTDTEEITWHVKYHGFHAILKAKGDNVAKSHKLPPCTLSSLESNTFPNRGTPLICQWNSCNEKFSGQIELINHVHFYHLLFLQSKSKERVKCQWTGCSLTTTKKSKLIDHVRMHTGDKAVACSHCGQMHANKTKFINHRNRQLPITEQSPQCSHCLVHFPNVRFLRIHMRQHVHLYKCCYCDITCSTVSILSAHIKYRHLPYKPFKCTECSYVCKSKIDLSKHMMTHSGNIFICAQEGCNAQYRTVYSLDRHFEKEHTENPQLSKFACHLCSKTFTRGAKLTKHLCSKHKVTKTSGYSRFEYRREEDGYYRLQTTRLESLEVVEIGEWVVVCDSESKEVAEEDVDDPTPIEHIKNINGTLPIEVKDNENIVISCNVVTTDQDLPPEARVVAIGE